MMVGNFKGLDYSIGAIGFINDSATDVLQLWLIMLTNTVSLFPHPPPSVCIQLLFLVLNVKFCGTGTFLSLFYVCVVPRTTGSQFMVGPLGHYYTNTIHYENTNNNYNVYQL